MNVISLDKRLRKVEAKRRPTGVFYLAWAASADEVDAVRASALASGAIENGSLAVEVVWPCCVGMPANRWATGAIGEFPWAEFGALAERAQRRAAEVSDALGWPPPVDVEPESDDAPAWPHPAVRPQHLNQVPDAVLLATCLGQRIGHPRVAPEAMTEPALFRLFEAILEIDTRAGIRGCFDVLDRLRDGQRASA